MPGIGVAPQDRPNAALMALAEKRRTQSIIPPDISGKGAIVQSYNAEAQTVDVVLKLDPGAHVIRGCRIAGTNKGVLRLLRAFKSIEQDGIEEATVGYIVYPSTDHSGAFTRHNIRRAFSRTKYPHQSPIFLTDLHIDEDGSPHDTFDPEEGGSDYTKIGPGDEAVIFGNGNMIVSKSSGEMVFWEMA